MIMTFAYMCVYSSRRVWSIVSLGWHFHRQAEQKTNDCARVSGTLRFCFSVPTSRPRPANSRKTILVNNKSLLASPKIGGWMTDKENECGLPLQLVAFQCDLIFVCFLMAYDIWWGQNDLCDNRIRTRKNAVVEWPT